MRFAFPGFVGTGRPLQIVAMALSLGPSGCDKSAPTQDAASSGGRGPKSPSALVGAEQKRGAPEPSDGAPVEPPVRTQGDTPESELAALSQGAQEASLAKPEFSTKASPSFQEAFNSLNTWVHSKGGEIHAALVDLQTDTWLLQSESQKAVNVASNAKIVTAAAALELLGPAHTFRTELRGDISVEGRASRLILVGGGAPDLTSGDLWRLVSVARGRGLAVVGDIVVDQSRFDENYEPPAYSQQPNEWAPFRANISALALDGNTVTLNVSTTQAGEAARVWYYPKGVVSPLGRVQTGEKGSGDRVVWNLLAKNDPQNPDSKVGGTLAAGLGRRSYARRLVDPRLAGGLALKALLEDAGVEVKGEVKLGTGGKEGRLALWTSEPLAELTHSLGKSSDNFTAEMLLVALSAKDGADKKKPWSSVRGAAVAHNWLREIGVTMDGIVVKNGSGLFDGNRYSAEALVKVLAHMEDNPRVYQDFVSQLAMGGTDGTMKKRMRGKELGPRIRAKTGTLRGVIALSGYVQRTGGRSPAAFSITVIGINGRYGEIRNRVDKAVLKWAALLEEESHLAK